MSSCLCSLRTERLSSPEAASRFRDLLEFRLRLATHTTTGLVASDITNFAPVSHAVTFPLANCEEFQDFKMPVGVELALEFPFTFGEPRVEQLAVGEAISGYRDPFPVAGDKHKRRVFWGVAVTYGFHASAQQFDRFREAIGNRPWSHHRDQGN